jgi:hypothetical protein
MPLSSVVKSLKVEGGAPDMTRLSNLAEANLTRATGEPLTGQFIQPTGARRETSPGSFFFQGLTRFLPTGKPGGSLAKTLVGLGEEGEGWTRSGRLG